MKLYPMVECQHVANQQCNHEACVEWARSYAVHEVLSGPTEADLCAGGGHSYYGDDAGQGRCYCGERLYPVGGKQDV